MPSQDEQEVEAAIQEKGLNAPRLTPDAITAKIVRQYFHRVPHTTVLICALTLENGYVVVGKAAAASPENYDEDIGQRIAFDDARNQIWALEGYLLREKLAKQ